MVCQTHEAHLFTFFAFVPTTARWMALWTWVRSSNSSLGTAQQKPGKKALQLRGSMDMEIWCASSVTLHTFDVALAFNLLYLLGSWFSRCLKSLFSSRKKAHGTSSLLAALGHLTRTTQVRLSTALSAPPRRGLEHTTPLTQPDVAGDCREALHCERVSQLCLWPFFWPRFSSSWLHPNSSSIMKIKLMWDAKQVIWYVQRIWNRQVSAVGFGFLNRSMVQFVKVRWTVQPGGAPCSRCPLWCGLCFDRGGENCRSFLVRLQESEEIEDV